MNDTASAGGASGASLIPSTTDAFTAAHLVIVAIFAIVVIVGIVWGVRLKSRRRAAERDIATRNAEIADTTAAAPPSVEPTPAPASPAPPSATPTPLVESEAPPTPVPQDDTPPSDPIADEPIAASAPLAATPATKAASAPAAPAPAPAPASTPATSPADAPVGTLKGLGPKLTNRLAELGINTVGQVAALTDDEAIRLDAQLGPFAGRMTRDRWIEQARFLAAGDTAGFEAVFGRL